MRDLSCLAVDDAIIAYTANGLEEQERCAVAEHLAECRKHDAELQAVRADLSRIALAVPPRRPPEYLRTRLLEAFDREDTAGEVTLAAQADATPVQAQPAAILSRRRAFWATSPAFGYALAAALMVLAVGLAAWGLSRGGGESEVLVRRMSEGPASMEVTYLPSQQLAVLDVNLPDLPPGRIYQAWKIQNGAPASIGLISQTTGKVALQLDLTGADAIALTIEPAGGSTSPTTAPLLSGNLNES